MKKLLMVRSKQSCGNMNWEDLDVWLSVYLSNEYCIVYAVVIMILELLLLILIRIFGITISIEGFG